MALESPRKEMISPPLLFTFAYLIAGLLIATYCLLNEKRQELNEMAFDMNELSDNEKDIARWMIIVLDILLWPLTLHQISNLK
jgi:hypothetical protein